MSFSHHGLQLLAIAFGTVIAAEAATPVPPPVGGSWITQTSWAWWGEAANWAGRTMASGPAATAAFDRLDLKGDLTVQAGFNPAAGWTGTIGNLVFGDLDPVTAGSICLFNSNGNTTLTLAGPAPTITVNPMSAGKSAMLQLPIAGSHGLTKAGPGTLTLAAANTYSGVTKIRDGTLALAGQGSLASGAVVANAGTLDLAGLSAESATIGMVIGPGAIVLGTRNLSLGGIPGDASISGIISGPGGSLTKTGTGVLTLAGANTYGGTTTVSGGILKAGVAAVEKTSGAFGYNSSVVLANAPGLGLDLNGFDTSIGSLSGGGRAGGCVQLGAATLTVGDDSASPAVYAGTITGGGGLIKTGQGTQILAGTNTYRGATAVRAGTLLVDGVGSGVGPVTVASGGCLGGRGRLAGAVIVAADGRLRVDVPDWTGANAPRLTVGAVTFSGKWTLEVGSASAHFKEASAHFPILTSATGLTGFQPDQVTVNLSAGARFSGTGSWAVQQSGRTLYLIYRAGACAIPASPHSYYLEAENGYLTGVATTTATAGFSGAGYVTGFSLASDRVAWNLYAAAGVYRMRIHYRSTSHRCYAGAVNGAGLTGEFPLAGEFAWRDAGLVELQGGLNSLFLGGGWQHYEIDAITLDPARPTPLQPVPAIPCDPRATPAAQALLKTITAHYGTRTLSGQNELPGNGFKGTAHVRAQSG
ncbi:MAG: autotransporter-associated beta strand repeat-containing protein, partial [Verrucomicrobiota bacterium]